MNLFYFSCEMAMDHDFKKTFIEFINNFDQSKWDICLDLLYDTCCWKFDDSPEQNGSYKMETHQYNGI